VTGRRSIAWALLLIAIGVVLLLREARVIPEDVAWWPILVFGLGAWLFAERLISRDRGGGDFVLPLVLMAVGVIFFLQQSDLVANDATLWPVLLIAIGIGIVLSALPLGRRSSVLASERASVRLGGATSGRVVVKHGGGRLSIRSAHDPGVLVEGSFAGGVGPRERRNGEVLEVTLERRDWMPWARRLSADWDIGISRQIPVSLQVDAGANRAELDLSHLTVPDLRVNTGASETSITMPARGRTRALITCGAASVRIRIPDRTPARIAMRTGLMSVRVDEARFPREDGGGFRSREFDRAGADGVDLTIEGGAASVEVR
jgi:cell wall-active antibiotic response 4TMS protein YvqF